LVLNRIQQKNKSKTPGSTDILTGGKFKFSIEQKLKHHKSMKNSELKCNLEVEGVTLTATAIKRLKSLQDRGNEDLKSTREIIADVVCFLAKKMDYIEDVENEEISSLMNSLSHIRENLNDLSKP